MTAPHGDRDHSEEPCFDSRCSEQTHQASEGHLGAWWPPAAPAAYAVEPIDPDEPVPFVPAEPSDAIRSLVDSVKAQGKAERTIRDLRAEIERLHAVEFIHAGCAGLRERDNAHMIARAETAEAEVERLRVTVARVEALADRLAALDGGKPGVIGWWPQTISVGDVLRDLRATLKGP